MIKLYSGNTPNVFKVTIALSEMGLASERIPVDILKGEQFDPAFLTISPNNRIPAIVDTDPADGGAPISIFESGAILIYLAEKTGKLLPQGPREKADVVQWVMWQMAGQGPMLGQLGHFLYYAPEKLPYAIERYRSECLRLYGVLEKQLARREYICGEYSIADIMCWPWILYRQHHMIPEEDFPNVLRWFKTIEARAAVKEAMKDAVIAGPAVLDEETRKIIFGTKHTE